MALNLTRPGGKNGLALCRSTSGRALPRGIA
jgi:hypothetical protein